MSTHDINIPESVFCMSSGMERQVYPLYFLPVRQFPVIKVH